MRQVGSPGRCLSMEGPRQAGTEDSQLRWLLGMGAGGKRRPSQEVGMGEVGGWSCQGRGCAGAEGGCGWKHRSSPHHAPPSLHPVLVLSAGLGLPEDPWAWLFWGTLGPDPIWTPALPLWLPP